MDGASINSNDKTFPFKKKGMYSTQSEPKVKADNTTHALWLAFIMGLDT